MRDATAIIAIARPLRVRDLRIEAPLLFAGAGIERDHLIEGRAKDETVFDEQRRRLEFGALHRLGRAALQVAGAIRPGAHELTDILRRDLVEPGKARATLIAAPKFPARGGRSRKHDPGETSGENAHADVPSGEGDVFRRCVYLGFW